MSTSTGRTTALASIIGVLVLISCSGSGTDGQSGLEVHEWGVLVGSDGGANYDLTSRPEAEGPIAEIPVLYFHSDDKTPFSAKVTFHSGGPTLTYPGAEMGAGTATWDTVHFAQSALSSQALPAGIPVPLEQIVSTLNNVDAAGLDYRGTFSRFLFYEGSVPFSSPIEASYNLTGLRGMVKNKGSYPVHNVVLAVSPPDAKTGLPNPRIVYKGVLDVLHPGVDTTIEIARSTDVDLADDLMAEGFTRKEAKAFEALWETPALNPALPFDPSQQGAAANLMYRLPQAEYDKLITLEINPAPRVTIRTLYVLMHLNTF